MVIAYTVCSNKKFSSEASTSAFLSSNCWSHASSHTGKARALITMLAQCELVIKKVMENYKVFLSFLATKCEQRPFF